MEDIDAPRVVAGAAERQLADLAELGLAPDEVLLQTARRPRHWELFLEAVRVGVVYPCFCSRKDVVDDLSHAASAPHGQPPLYSGRCRSRPPGEVPRAGTRHPTLAWRFRSTADPNGARDFLVARTGPIREGVPLPEETSFTPSYNWACAIDDQEGRHSLLVRAWDLFHVASQQREIQRWLSDGNVPSPAIFHCALVTGESGERLEKRTRGVTLPELIQARISPQDLARAFEASFAGEARPFAAGELWGERRRALTIGELVQTGARSC